MENAAIVRSGYEAFGVAAPDRDAKTVIGCFRASLQQLGQLHIELDGSIALVAEPVLALGARPWTLRVDVSRRGSGT